MENYEINIIQFMITNLLNYYNSLNDWNIEYSEEGFFRLNFITDDNVYIDMIPDIEEITCKYDPGIFLNIENDCIKFNSLSELMIYWNMMYTEVALDEPC